MPRKTIILDFDGVIHSYTSGWKGADVIPDPPVAGAFEFIHEALRHFDVAIYSSRSHQGGGVAAMIKWFREHRLGESAISLLDFPDHKPPALVSIDDRAITFHGDFPTIQSLLNFKTWQER